MNIEERWYKNAVKELVARGYGNVSRAIMEEWLHNGLCSQSDYDLYIDIWMSDQLKWSVSQQAAQQAADRLAAKFSMG